MSADFLSSPDEKLLWEGRPEFKPFIIYGILDFLSSLKFLAFAWTAFILLSKVGNHNLNWTMMWLIAFIIIGAGLFKIGKRYFDQKAITYYLTNWRVVIVNKNAAITTKSIARSSIKSLDMQVSKTEQKYHTGTILIDTGEVWNNDGIEEKVIYRLEAIAEPENVLRLL
jgi:hypothetical protein